MALALKIEANIRPSIAPRHPGRFSTINGSEFNNKMFVMAYILGE